MYIGKYLTFTSIDVPGAVEQVKLNARLVMAKGT